MAGHIDSSITAGSKREAAVLDAIRARGLTLHRLHRDGRALRLSGPGIFLTVADLGALSLHDLEPPTGAEIMARTRTIRG